MLVNLASYYTPKVASDPLQAIIDAHFSAGTVGGIYIPQPVVLGQQVLFQDLAKTVPASADNDPVRVMVDVSGNYPDFIAPSDAARPLYKTNGTTHRLLGDGTDDRMVLAGTASLPDDATGFSVIAGARRTGSFGPRLSQYNAGDNSRVWALNSVTTADSNYHFGVQVSASYDAGRVVSTPAPSTDHVVNSKWPGAGTAAQIRVDRGAWSTATSTLTSLGGEITQEIELFSVNNGGLAHGAEFTGIFLRRGAFSTTAEQEIEDYLASLIGVTL